MKSKRFVVLAAVGKQIFRNALLLSLPLFLTVPEQAYAVQEGGNSSATSDMSTGQGASHETRADISVFSERLRFHEENRNDLRLAPIKATDRRKAIPNDSRPPSVTEPKTKLPPLPISRDGVVRRVILPASEKVCALTFDTCELATVTTGVDVDIIVWLQDNNIPATFFMGGKWMRTHAQRVHEIMRDPLFEIGNHAWTHGNFGIMSPERMKEELLFTQAQYELLRKQAIQEARRMGTGPLDIPPVPIVFRFPYGRSSEAALNLLAENGLRPIQWDVMADGGGNNASLSRAKTVASAVRPGSILLFHANLVPTGSFQLLRYVVRELQQEGYHFVTVSDLLTRGKSEMVKDGYFIYPGDNISLDTKYGKEGTGLE